MEKWATLGRMLRQIDDRLDQLEQKVNEKEINEEVKHETTMDHLASRWWMVDGDCFRQYLTKQSGYDLVSW